MKTLENRTYISDYLKIKRRMQVLRTMSVLGIMVIVGILVGIVSYKGTIQAELKTAENRIIELKAQSDVDLASINRGNDLLEEANLANVEAAKNKADADAALLEAQKQKDEAAALKAEAMKIKEEAEKQISSTPTVTPIPTKKATLTLTPKATSKPKVTTSSNTKKTEYIRFGVTDSELNMLNKLAEAEAGGEPYNGRVAVVAVVINRIRSGNFQKTVEGVIFAHGQFTCTVDGGYRKAIPSKSTKNAVIDALNGEDPSHGALYFLNPEKVSDRTLHWFYQLKLCARIGGHEFRR